MYNLIILTTELLVFKIIFKIMILIFAPILIENIDINNVKKFSFSKFSIIY